VDVTLPNGVVIQGIPEGTNKWTIAEKAISKGLARPEDFGQESADPTAGMGGFEKFRAGYGKAAVDLGRGAGQLVGLVDREDVQSSRERDAPLMATGAGKAGYFGGAVANALPAAFIPGANTMAGATAVGAGLGLLQPSASTGETLTNVAGGGALGPAGLAVGRGGAALYRGGKAIVEPFTKGGQERIASRTLQAFAGGSKEATKAIQNIDDAMLGNYLGIKPFPEGVMPTTAELANNPGLAQLERTLKNNPEYLTAMTDRSTANKDAMLSAVDEVAGSDWQMAGAKSVREARTNSLYDEANKVTVSADDKLRELLDRPSMKAAWSRASQLAQEKGQPFVVGKDIPEKVTESRILDAHGKPASSIVTPAQSAKYSGRSLHYLKMAMDDLADNPQASGIGGNEVRALNATKHELVDWIGKNIPKYDQARKTYAGLSRPINQMEIGTALRNKLQPALADFGAGSRTRAAAYAEALRSGDDFASQTLGRSNSKMSQVMEPEQLSKLHMVAEQLGRRANADELGKAIGSNTGQNMVSQNILRQLLGPLGLPESTIQRAAESTLLQSVMRPAQFAGQLGEERVMQTLAKAALDPKVAKEMLRVGIDPKSIGLLLRNQQYIAPALVSGTNAARQ
jgi:hypothetical protein